jgi:hypothetical protein
MLKCDELANPQSCLNRAHLTERIFVLLARDICAPATVRFWVDERIRRGRNTLRDPQIQDALRLATMMEQTREDHHTIKEGSD